ncbi:PREDICTED: pentatricopeptide repeat-containing protein At1g31790 [Nelumbo nucifera]|uniref:Pentatricopeptide repeat-containing protein At1g31790 n=2 Tax=Nelumbo nucifera TaxID=4432 RepID=A0A1U8AF50_NELNU|nr:PREDICTED: pentatricopeptide repeat-containing protein At1g31790 [Nelumbo nucifera]XP_010260474.1 PREDICTED: pentatricopeptide repeat-containing protein At1g31790 [Nelumbo nucifera]DAD22674.1 TPA_asm: hypothetical protein HUJ06_024137 [Nelumbo nucifera]
MAIIPTSLKVIPWLPSKCVCSCCLQRSSIPPTTPIQYPAIQRPSRKIPCPSNVEIKLNQHRSRSTTTTTTDVLCLMDSLHLRIPADIYASLLKECTDARDATRGAEVHAHMNRSGFRPGLPLANRLLLMYVACSRLDDARKVFDKMTIRDSISWATLIAGYVNHGDCKEAISLFLEMQQGSGLEFTDLIIVSIFKACVHIGEFGLGKQIHGWIFKVGYHKNLFFCSALINFYRKFKCLEDAQFVFNGANRRDTVLWNDIITGYSREGQFDEVLDIFKEMGRAGASKNNFTFSTVLRASGRVRDYGQCGKQVHASTIKLGVEMDLFVQSSLVDMYGRQGLLRDARRVFEMIGNERNDVCWNAMFIGYLQHGFYNDAIKFLYEMKAAGLQPQESMLTKLRIACGSWSPHVSLRKGS